jgi:PAS domain S-box-containing protein
MNKAVTVSRSVAVALGLIAFIVLTGWQLNIPALKGILSNDRVPMVANSAFCFLSAGFILYLSTLRITKLNTVLIQGFSVLIFLIGLFTFIEYSAAVDFGIDQFIFDQPNLAGNHPGRMSILSAVNFALIGMCFWIDAMVWGGKKNIAQYCVLLVFFITLYPLAGTIFGAQHVGSLNTTMALPTAVCFLLLSSAYFIIHSKKGWASLLFADTIAGVLIRRMLVPVALIYPVFAFFSVQGEKAGFYNTEGGTVFIMVSSLALFTTIVLVTAQTISRLDHEKDQFKKFFELSSEVLMIAGPDGSIKLVSKAFTKVLGYSNQEGINNSFFHFIHPEDTRIAIHHFDMLQKDTVFGTFQVQMKCKNGTVRHFLWSSTIDRETGELYAAGYDITEIKEAHQVRELAKQLSNQNEQLASFAHIVSHNLRSHVGNLTSLLPLHKIAEPNERAGIFTMFEKVALHLSTTLNDLIESLRIKEDISKERHVIYFEQVLLKTKEILASQILESNAVITANFKIHSIEYPIIYLESIFLNLFSNAIKYRSSERPLHINVETFLTNGELALLVQDNGEGIDMIKYGDKLFGFYKTFHARQDSKGIGLFITKTQIEAMGGTIAVESEVNKGTIFKVVFNKS